LADILETIGLLAVALLAVGVGVGTLRDIGKGGTQTLSRGAPRMVSRSIEPLGFWATMFAGLIWLMLGFFLLALATVCVLHYF